MRCPPSFSAFSFPGLLPLPVAVPLRVGAVPGPGVGDDLLQVPLRLPAQFLQGLLVGGDEDGGVPGPPGLHHRGDGRILLFHIVTSVKWIRNDTCLR